MMTLSVVEARPLGVEAIWSVVMRALPIATSSPFPEVRHMVSPLEIPMDAPRIPGVPNRAP
jgi:hypothetical protein